jgi:hypothetical protein
MKDIQDTLYIAIFDNLKEQSASIVEDLINDELRPTLIQKCTELIGSITTVTNLPLENDKLEVKVVFDRSRLKK